MACVAVATAYDSLDHHRLVNMFNLHIMVQRGHAESVDYLESWQKRRMAWKHLAPYSSRKVCHRADFLGYRKPISQKVTHLPYVDDLKIYASSEKNLQRMMENVKDGLKCVALQWN